MAISNNRLLRLEDGKVDFTWKDYPNGNRVRTMKLDAHEFIRRFLIHVLPDGFQRIRHYGFLANRCRDEKLALCRKLLDAPGPEADQAQPEDWKARYEALTGEPVDMCRVCRKGRMIPVATLEPDSSALASPRPEVDSS